MMRAHEPLTLRSLSGRAVVVPMKRPLGTSVETIEVASLLLIDLATNEGIVGRAYAFCYRPSIARAGEALVEDLAATLQGAPVVPLELSRRLRSLFRLPGLAGPLTMVASAVDMAAWDAVAVAADLPLATLLGSAPKPIPAYNSNGLGLIAPEAAADEAEQLLAEGFKAVKLRVGRQDPAADLTAVRAVRKRIPADASLMLDFNQALSFAAAMQRCRALDDEGAYWIEEPIRHDDYVHCALVADSTRTPIQIGENISSLSSLAAALSATASDYLMLDVDRIGGVSGWRSAAGLAEAGTLEVSSHLYPEVSAHLLAATPTAHWLEFVDWAGPILQERLEAVDGHISALSGPGIGLRWDEDAISRFRLKH
jgi:mandelate racemase